jgi:hypothetical protein
MLIKVDGVQPLADLQRLLGGTEHRGKGRVTIVFDLDRRGVELTLPQRYAVSPKLRSEIKRLPGVWDVQEL